ncbi:MAG: hypothetical protein K0R57_1787 [Paenibacillaceae bacterium]|nr:hypothetical protein [Paenibacillaceae bacterium]
MRSSKIKTVQIYKTDKWNMMNVEINGKNLILREISEQWGEECHTFLSRPAMMHWAEARFSEERFQGTPEERAEIMEKFRQV